MRRELWRIVEDEIRCFLHRQGSRPLMLREAQLETDCYGGRPRLRFVLVDGSDWCVSLHAERFALYGAGDDRLFSRDCVRLYSQLLEDHLLEERLRAARESFRRASESATDPEQVRRAYQDYEGLERHLRRHHRVRRDNPMMPLEPHQGVPGPDGTLTLESLQRAMEMLRIAPEPSRFSLAPGAINYIGVDWAGDVGDEKAQARALALFKSRLSAAQLAQYESKKHFEVIGSETGKRYRIRHGRQMNIDELDAKGEKVCGWCFLPQGGLAAGDVMLAQKIALECDESEALKVANRFANASDGQPPGGTYTFAALAAEEVRRRYIPVSGDWLA